MKKYRYMLAFIGWAGIVIMLIILSIAIEEKPEIPQYDAVWRGVVDPPEPLVPTDTIYYYGRKIIRYEN